MAAALWPWIKASCGEKKGKRNGLSVNEKMKMWKLVDRIPVITGRLRVGDVDSLEVKVKEKLAEWMGNGR